MLKRRDRVTFEGVQLLADAAGCAPVLIGEGPIPADFDDRQRTMALAEGADTALGLLIETATGPGRPNRKLYKTMTAQTAAQAIVFCAHALAGICGRLAEAPGHHLDPAAQRDARTLLRGKLPWTDAGEAEISQITGLIDPDDASGVDDAQLACVLGCLRIIVGDEQARLLPELRPFFDADPDPAEQYTCNLSWQICFNHATGHWLSLTDPDGLARAG